MGLQSALWYADGMVGAVASSAESADHAEGKRALPGSVTRSLRAYHDALRQEFGPRLRELRLFGSYARGDMRPESDVDVFVAIDSLTHAERDRAFDLAYLVELNGVWVGLAPLVYSTEQANELRSRERRLLLDIDAEGVEL